MPQFKPRNWTEAELAELPELVKTRTWAEIAAHFGCSDTTAKDKARYARVIDVMNALSKARITNVTFGTASED